MAKRSYTRRVSKQDDLNTGESLPPETVRLVCLLGATVKVGPPEFTKNYVFNMGNPLDVNVEDANILLSKRKGCCGTAPKPIFVEV